MSIKQDVHKLEPGAKVELFELDASNLGGDVLYFHGYTDGGPVVWKGQTYLPWPIEAEGFEVSGDSRQGSPTLTVSNIDGTIGAMALFLDDLVGAKLTRRRTLAKYLDGQEQADPNEELPSDVWFLEVKSEHNKLVVAWELKSALDFGEVYLPRRLIVQNLCPWAYRGADCGYTGPAVADRDDNPTTDPSRDDCSHSLTGCKIRFGRGDIPFGGFSSASLSR